MVDRILKCPSKFPPPGVHILCNPLPLRVGGIWKDDRISLLRLDYINRFWRGVTTCKKLTVWAEYPLFMTFRGSQAEGSTSEQSNWDFCTKFPVCMEINRTLFRATTSVENWGGNLRKERAREWKPQILGINCTNLLLMHRWERSVIRKETKLRYEQCETEFVDEIQP